MSFNQKPKTHRRGKQSWTKGKLSHNGEMKQETGEASLNYFPHNCEVNQLHQRQCPSFPFSYIKRFPSIFSNFSHIPVIRKGDIFPACALCFPLKFRLLRWRDAFQIYRYETLVSRASAALHFRLYAIECNLQT